MPAERRKRRKRRRSGGNSPEDYRGRLQKKAPNLKRPLIFLGVFLVAAIGFVFYWEATRMQTEPASAYTSEADPLAEIRGGSAIYGNAAEGEEGFDEAVARGAVAEDMAAFQAKAKADAEAGRITRESVTLFPQELEDRTGGFLQQKRNQQTPASPADPEVPGFRADLDSLTPGGSPGVEYSNMHVLDPEPHADDDALVEPGSAADALRMPQTGESLDLPNMRDWSSSPDQ